MNLCGKLDPRCSVYSQISQLTLPPWLASGLLDGGVQGYDNNEGAIRCIDWTVRILDSLR